MVNPPESSGNRFITDRRNDRREKVLFSSVVLSEVHCGRVLNISPKGLALQTDVVWMGDEFPHMRFKFSPSLAWVETRGRVAWRSDSARVVGLRFIGITDEVGKEIQTWIASKNDSGEFPKKTMSLEGAESLAGADASLQITAAVRASVPELVDLRTENRSEDSIITSDQSHAGRQDARTAVERAADVEGGISKTRWLVGLALTAALLLSVLLLRGLHLQKSGNDQKSREMTHVLHSPEERTPAAPSSKGPLVPSSKNVVSRPFAQNGTRHPLRFGSQTRLSNPSTPRNPRISAQLHASNF